MAQENIPVVFMHIPKTAGISFVRSLCDVWPNQIVDMYGASDADPRPVKDFLRSPVAKTIRLFAGHISFGIHHWIPGGQCYYLSLLREPVARILSLYRHSHMFRSRLRSLHHAENIGMKDLLNRILRPGAFPDFHLDFIDWIAGDGSLEGFLACPSAELDNAMVRRFSGWGVRGKRCPFKALALAQQNIESQFAAVGLVEEYAKTLELFQSVLKLPPLAVRHDNASNANGDGHKNKNAVQPVRIEPQTMARICEMNQMDMALYEWTKRRFAIQVEQASRRLKPILAQSHGPYRRCPLWKSVGTLGLSPIVVGSNHASPVKCKRERATEEKIEKKRTTVNVS